MRILILTVGPRGDVQPYVALGKGLVASGHDVTLCTSESVRPFVEEHGLSYAYMNNGFVQFMRTDLSREAMEQMSSLCGLIRYAPKLWQQSKTPQHDLIRDAWSAAASVQPDLILYHPKMYIAPHTAERLQVPVALPFVIPMSAPTTAFPSPGVPHLTGLPDRGRSYLQSTVVSPRARSHRAWHTPIRADLARIRGFTAVPDPYRALPAVQRASGLGAVRVQLPHRTASARLGRACDDHGNVGNKRRFFDP